MGNVRRTLVAAAELTPAAGSAAGAEHPVAFSPPGGSRLRAPEGVAEESAAPAKRERERRWRSTASGIPEIFFRFRKGRPERRGRFHVFPKSVNLGHRSISPK